MRMNLPVADVDTAKGFCADYLGLRTEAFNMAWVAGYTYPETGANLQLVTRGATSSADSAICVRCAGDTVDLADALARRIWSTQPANGTDDRGSGHRETLEASAVSPPRVGERSGCGAITYRAAILLSARVTWSRVLEGRSPARASRARGRPR